jgi:amino acid transporter
MLGFTASNCIVFGEYVLFALGREPSAAAQKTLAVGLLTGIIIMHGCFRRTGIFVQNVLGWVKIALILFMVLTSLYVVIFRSRERAKHIQPRAIPISTNDYFWGGSVWDWGTISTALFKVFYSYAGLQNVNNVMNEVRNPVKTLKSAANTALLTSAILYLMVNVAYFLIVPMDDIKHSGELIAALFFERIFGPGLGKTILPLAIAISAAGNVMVVTFSHVSLFSRLLRFTTN